jgi:hypothetical protein
MSVYWGCSGDWKWQALQAGGSTANLLQFLTPSSPSSKVQLELRDDASVDLPNASTTGGYRVNGTLVVKAQGAHIVDAATDLDESNTVTGADTVDQSDLEGILDALATRVNVVAGKVNAILAVLDTTHGLVAGS